MHQQLLLHKLSLYLTQLHGAHTAAIGRQFAGRVRFELNKQVHWRCGSQYVVELLFEHGEGKFESLQVQLLSFAFAIGARLGG